VRRLAAAFAISRVIADATRRGKPCRESGGKLPHSIFISAHCSVIEHGAMVCLFWRHSNNRWRSEDRRYEPFAETALLALLHPHSGFARDHRNRALLRILRLHLQDLDLRFSVTHGSND
jgi:hypothetical protein